METAGFEAPWPTVFRFLLADPNEGLNLRNDVLHDLVDRRPAQVLQAALVVLRSIAAYEPPEKEASPDTPG